MTEIHPLKTWRDNNGVTQEQMGTRASLTAGRISQIESGYSPPGRDAIARISTATGGEVSIVQLHTWKPPKGLRTYRDAKADLQAKKKAAAK